MGDDYDENEEENYENLQIEDEGDGHNNFLIFISRQIFKKSLLTHKIFLI